LGFFFQTKFQDNFQIMEQIEKMIPWIASKLTRKRVVVLKGSKEGYFA